MIHDYTVDQASETGLFPFFPLDSIHIPNSNLKSEWSGIPFKFRISTNGDTGGKRKSTPLTFSLHLQKREAFCALSFTPRRVSSFPLELLLILGSPGGGQREYSQSNVVLVNSSITYYKFFIVFFSYY